MITHYVESELYIVNHVGPEFYSLQHMTFGPKFKFILQG